MREGIKVLLKHNFDERTLTRGRAYAEEGRVKLQKHRHSQPSLQLHATVRGRETYETHVNINLKTKNVSSTCDCHVSSLCKHAVATILCAYDEGVINFPDEAGQIDLHPEVLQHLKAQANRVHSRVKESKRLDKFALYQISFDTRYLDKTLKIQMALTHRRSDGHFAKLKSCNVETIKHKIALDEKEIQLLALIKFYQEDTRLAFDHVAVASESCDEVLSLLLETGRCYFQDKLLEPLQLGEPRDPGFVWQPNQDGDLVYIAANLTPQMELVPLGSGWYYDKVQRKIGRLLCPRAPREELMLAALPPVPQRQIKVFKQQLAEYFPKAKLNTPTEKAYVSREVGTQCQGRLQLSQQSLPGKNYRRNGERVNFLVAHALFSYGDYTVDYDEAYPAKSSVIEGDTQIIVKRCQAFEKTLINQLLKAYNAEENDLRLFELLDKDYLLEHYVGGSLFYLVNITDKQALLQFAEQVKPSIVKAGWQIEVAQDVPAMQVLEAQSWYSDLEESSGSDWFDIEIGVTVQDKPISLIPVILEAIESGQFDAKVTDDVVLSIPGEGFLRLEAERVRQVLQVILSLYDPKRYQVGDKALMISKQQANVLNELQQGFTADELRWFGTKQLLDLAEKLQDFTTLAEVTPPESLQATLRDYQQTGVNWLQFLREFALGGVLADDMGLGKTLQTIAHVCIEKEAGRLTDPCLILAPTSVVGNWQAEFARFAPHIKTLVLHGTERKNYFADIADVDVVLTTYPLLIRDKAVLLAQTFYLLVLDEAQFIKNNQAKMTQVAHQLQAEHRLALSGTPLENHLGELWSLFNFLMPGFLGNKKEFKQRYQTPIEKQQDDQAQARLARLVKPFLLRRTKNEVLDDLPEKTEIIKSIEFSDPERDLYESVRLTMNKKVREAIDEKGIERCQIMILDALLKLRQACCSPRLLGSEQAASVETSAKLETLSEWLPKMVTEGRRVLIFSQFTSMLGLIEERLKQQALEYTKLTGATRNRQQAVDDFQQGKVPIFLISLKAGGTGLNLTAADTVIHVDPWWNPAVENQATDRAHRIGQKNKVFVYKLVVKDSVEEKIVILQEKKKALMDALFAEKSSGKITQDDLTFLFQDEGE